MIDLAEELLSDVLVVAPGCPDTMIEKVLSRSVRQFCSDTQAWRVTTSPQPVIKGLREVQLSPPANTTIFRPYWVTLKDKQLLGVSETKLVDREGTPTGYVLAPDGVLKLDCLPRETIIQNGLTAHFSVVPNRGQAILPDELEHFVETVQTLATAYLLTMPGVEWRDRQAAGDMFSIYQSSLADARRYGQQFNQPVHRTVAYGGI